MEVPTMHPLIRQHEKIIAALCRRHDVLRLDVFGSVLSPDFDPAHSDVDLTVEFDPAATGSGLNRYFDLKRDLESVLGRPVDLVELSAMPETRLKRSIARSKIPLYAATT